MFFLAATEQGQARRLSPDRQDCLSSINREPSCNEKKAVLSEQRRALDVKTQGVFINLYLFMPAVICCPQEHPSNPSKKELQ